MPDLLDHRRLRRQAAGHGPDVFGPSARAWISGVPAGLARIRRSGPGDLPAALHEMRSGAVAVGASALAAALAAIEQRAEAGAPPTGAELDRMEGIAARTVAALAAWWEGAGR